MPYSEWAYVLTRLPQSNLPLLSLIQGGISASILSQVFLLRAQRILYVKWRVNTKAVALSEWNLKIWIASGIWLQ